MENIATTKHYNECLPLQIDRSLVHSYVKVPYQFIPRQFSIVAAFKIKQGLIYQMQELMPPFVLQSLGH